MKMGCIFSLPPINIFYRCYSRFILQHLSIDALCPGPSLWTHTCQIMLKPGKMSFPPSLSHTQPALAIFRAILDRGKNILPSAPLQQQWFLLWCADILPSRAATCEPLLYREHTCLQQMHTEIFMILSEELPAGTRPRLLVIFSNQCYRRSRKPLEGCSSNSLHLELNYPFLYKSWHIKIKYDILWCLRWADNAPLPEIVKGERLGCVIFGFAGLNSRIPTLPVIWPFFT